MGDGMDAEARDITKLRPNATSTAGRKKMVRIRWLRIC